MVTLFTYMEVLFLASNWYIKKFFFHVHIIYQSVIRTDLQSDYAFESQEGKAGRISSLSQLSAYGDRRRFDAFFFFAHSFALFFVV